MRKETWRVPILKALRANRIWMVMVMGHFCLAAGISFVIGIPFELGVVSILIGLFGTLVPAFLVVLLVWKFVTLAVVDRPRRPARRFMADIRAVIADPFRLLSGVSALLVFGIFIKSFTLLKDSITHMNPFSWDPVFADLDRLMHFNRDPYELLMPILGTPLMTTTINAAYHFWLFLLFFVIFVASFDCNQTTARNRFLAAFVLCFALGGNLLATLLSSAGPVYYSTFGFGADFQPLLERLQQFAAISPVWALDVQDMLLEGYHEGGPVKGISAMPSMHVASSVLMAFYAFSWRRWAGWVLSGFALVIMLGSVHLAWHYAIDGYLGALIAWGCWHIAGKLERF